MQRNLLILLGVVVVGAIGAVLLFQFNGQPESQLAFMPEQPVSQINILSPSNGETFALGSAVTVDAFAFHAQPVTGIELWIDGQLMSLQEAIGEGQTPFSTSFLWTPGTEGVHTLIVRALGADGPLGFSPSVMVGVAEQELNGEVDQVNGVPNEMDDGVIPAVLPVNDDLGSSPAPPSGGGLPPAKPQGDSPDPGDADALPAAPELAVSVDSCTAMLAFHDLSDDEVGFFVYRQGSNAQNWQQVADLAASDGQGWLTYEESPGPGGFNYYIAAYNVQGESPSNPVLANFDGNCGDSQQDGEGVPVLELDLGELLADSGADQAYCYQTLDGLNWGRFPLEGFFMPGSQGGNSLISLTGPMEGGAETLDLMLECWGWMGGDLELIGNFHHEFVLPGEVGDGLTFQGSPLANVAQLLNFDGPTFYPMNDDFEGELFFDVGDDIYKFLLVHDPAMPTIFTFVTYDPDQCQSHLPPDAQNLFGKILFCTPYPGFDSGEGGGNPQPYLVWNFGDGCGAGYGSPPCNNYGYYDLLANTVGGNVWFTVTDTSSAGTFYWQVDAPYLFNLTIPPVACSGKRSFYVTMYFNDGEQTFYGLPSNIYDIDCPTPLPWDIPLEITYETISFSALDDGESDPDDIEIYGYMRTLVPGDELVYLNIAEWDEQDGDCPDEVIEWPGALNTQGLLIDDGCTKTFTNGTYQLSGVAMCQGTSKTNCNISGWNFNNNVVHVTVTDDQSLMLFLVAYDWDDASGNDLQCWSIAEFPPRSRFDWALVHDQHFSFIGFDQGNGNCSVSGTINAVVP
jgi:hypothetical protein